MTRPDMDDQLSELLHDSVADIEPTDRLGELRARTASSGSSRRWWIAAGGSALATAAAVTAIALVLSDPSPTAEPGPSGTPSGATDDPSGPVTAVAAYFVGDTPSGPLLYREFQQVVSPSPGLAGLELLESGANDPDYSSLWPAGSFESVSDPEAGVVHVFLGDAAPAEPSALAQQQVVYTVSAGFGEPLAVVLHRDDATSEEIMAAPQLDVLSRVNLSDPSEGQVVTDSLHVEGRANSFEANVLWTIESVTGGAGMGSYFTATGYMELRLFPFSDDIDVSSLDPGTYTLTVETDDPSGGAEGGLGVFTDTRTFVIE